MATIVLPVTAGRAAGLGPDPMGRTQSVIARSGATKQSRRTRRSAAPGLLRFARNDGDRVRTGLFLRSRRFALRGPGMTACLHQHGVAPC